MNLWKQLNWRRAVISVSTTQAQKFPQFGEKNKISKLKQLPSPQIQNQRHSSKLKKIYPTSTKYFSKVPVWLQQLGNAGMCLIFFAAGQTGIRTQEIVAKTPFLPPNILQRTHTQCSPVYRQFGKKNYASVIHALSLEGGNCQLSNCLRFNVKQQLLCQKRNIKICPNIFPNLSNPVPDPPPNTRNTNQVSVEGPLPSPSLPPVQFQKWGKSDAAVVQWQKKTTIVSVAAEIESHPTAKKESSFGVMSKVAPDSAASSASTARMAPSSAASSAG